MAWTVEFTETAARQLAALDRPTQRRIIQYLRKRFTASENPRHTGKALRGDKAGLWRYRVGDYRLICQLQDESCLILVLAVGHRTVASN